MSRLIELQTLLEEVREGRIDPSDALARIAAALRDQPFEDLGFAKVDHHRGVRQGFPEVVLGLGKTPDQIAGIAGEIVRRGSLLLVTRADEGAFAAVKAAVPAETNPVPSRAWKSRSQLSAASLPA